MLSIATVIAFCSFSRIGCGVPTGAKMPYHVYALRLTPLSFHASTEISVEAQRNRALLLGLMTAAGWDCYLNEWWHYQLFNPKRYPLLSDSAAGTRMMPQAGSM